MKPLNTFESLVLIIGSFNATEISGKGNGARFDSDSDLDFDLGQVRPSRNTGNKINFYTL
ncbi:MAG: hypothetical protein AAGH40_00670 [Verrucomicrobiota bacterium]